MVHPKFHLLFYLFIVYPYVYPYYLSVNGRYSVGSNGEMGFKVGHYL